MKSEGEKQATKYAMTKKVKSLCTESKLTKQQIFNIELDFLQGYIAGQQNMYNLMTEKQTKNQNGKN